MKQGYLQRHGKSGIELVEEAFSLIRHAPTGAMAVYLTGTIPFVAGLLFFWSFMSHNAFASRHLAAGSLGLTGLFLWMKFCHAAFAQALSASLSGESAPAIFRQSMATVVNQTILQATGLFVLPLASVAILPFPWAYAFYQNASALDDGSRDFGKLLTESRRQASLWPGQNAILLLLLSLFAFYILINWLSFCVGLPFLLKMLLGIESIATLSPLSLLNSTLMATLVCLTFLCVDPLLKACYVLRCFYGTSLESGEDLRSEAARFRKLGGAVALGILCLLGTPMAQGAEPPATAPPATSVSAPELDHRIETVLNQDKYVWRQVLPTKDLLPKGNILGKFFGQINEMAYRAIKSAIEFFYKLWAKIWGNHHKSSNTSTGNWISPLQAMLYAALGVAAAGLVFLIVRLILSRRAFTAESTALPIAPLPDLEDENTAADQLPEDRWLALGQELVARGELRAALRAFYLASLSKLAEASLVTIARGKSNRDYEREIKRRAHALGELPALFGENVRTFDRAWYGRHAVNLETVSGFRARVEKIRALS